MHALRSVFVTVVVMTLLRAVAYGQASWNKVTTTGSYRSRSECAFSTCGGTRLCLVGGRGANHVDILDTRTLTWTTGSTNSLEMNHVQAVQGPDACVWLAGAWTGPFPDETTVNDIWRYCPDSDAWDVVANIPRPRGAGGTVFHEGKLYMISGNVGGHNPDAELVPWFDCYDPSTDEWTTLEDVPRPRDHFHAVVLENKLYVIGGRNSAADDVFGDVEAAVDVYDFGSKSWVQGPELPAPRGGTSSAVYEGGVVVIGGEGEGRAWSEMDVLRDGAYSDGPPLPVPRHGTGVVSCASTLWIAGGATVQGCCDNAVDTYVLHDGDAPPVCTAAPTSLIASPVPSSSPPPSSAPGETDPSPSSSSSPTAEALPSLQASASPTAAAAAPSASSPSGMLSHSPFPSASLSFAPESMPEPSLQSVAPALSTFASASVSPSAVILQPASASPLASVMQPTPASPSVLTLQSSTSASPMPVILQSPSPSPSQSQSMSQSISVSPLVVPESQSTTASHVPSSLSPTPSQRADASPPPVQTTESPVPSSSPASTPISLQRSPSQSNSSTGDANDENAGPECFPEDAMVQLASGETKQMHELKVGDVVKAAHPDTFSAVYFFSHADADVRASAVRIETSISGVVFTASPGHLLYVNGHLVEAGRIRVGDILHVARDDDDDDDDSGSSTPSVDAIVVAVARSVVRGRFNPHTLHGDIVVNGIAASSFTTAVHPAVARTLLLPFRAAYRALGAHWTVKTANRAVIRGLKSVYWKN